MKRKITDEERKKVRKARNSRYQARLKVGVSMTSLAGFTSRTQQIEIGDETGEEI